MSKWVLFFVIFFSSSAFASEKPKIYVNKAVDHAAIQQTYQGMIDHLSQNGFIAGETFYLQTDSSQSNAQKARMIFDRFLLDNPDVIVTIGTLPTKIAVDKVRNEHSQVIVSSVTDPASIENISNSARPNLKIAGVSNFIPAQPQLEVIRSFYPNANKIGVVYNPEEPNSKFSISDTKYSAQPMGLEIIEYKISSIRDLPETAEALFKQVDAVFINNDNTAMSGFSILARRSQETKIPIFVSDIDAVSSGALAGIGPDQYEIGQQTASIILKALRGEDIRSIPTQTPDSYKIVVNEKVRHSLSVMIPNRYAHAVHLVNN